MQTPLGGLVKYCLITILCFCSWTGLLGQVVDVSLQMVPSDPDIGDTVYFEVHANTTNSISGFTVSLWLDDSVYDQSALVSSSTSSWLGTTSEVTASHNSSGDSLELTVTRSDSRTFSGNGVVARLDGIVILDDIHTKRKSYAAEVGRMHLPCTPRLYPNPSKGKIAITCGEHIEQIRLANHKGETWMREGEAVLTLTEIPDGLYYLEIKTLSGKCYYERLLIQR